MNKISRRTVAGGMAWSIPAIVVAGTAPAYAASGTLLTTSICSITYDNGTLSTQNMRVYLGVSSSTGIIPAGTVLTWTVTTSGGIAANNEVPSSNYTPSGAWSLSFSQPSGTVTNSYTVSLTFAADYSTGTTGTWCAAELLYTDIYSISPRTQFTITGTSTGSQASAPGGLTWTIPQRQSTSASSTYAMRFISKSGSQTCYPPVTYLYKSGTVAAQGTNGSVCGDGGNNSSTIYPDGTCRKVNITSGQATIPAVC